MTTQQIEKLSDGTLELLRRALDSDRHGISDDAAAEWLTARLAELYAESRSRDHGGHLVEVEQEDQTWVETFGVAQSFQAYCHCDWWGDEHVHRAAAVAEGDQHVAERISLLTAEHVARLFGKVEAVS